MSTSNIHYLHWNTSCAHPTTHNSASLVTIGLQLPECGSCDQRGGRLGKGQSRCKCWRWRLTLLLRPLLAPAPLCNIVISEMKRSLGPFLLCCSPLGSSGRWQLSRTRSHNPTNTTYAKSTNHQPNNCMLALVVMAHGKMLWFDILQGRIMIRLCICQIHYIVYKFALLWGKA